MPVILTAVASCMYTYTQAYQVVYFQRVQFIVYQLYLKLGEKKEI